MAEDYASMTVNERLFAAGLLEARDAALLRGDRDTVDAILARVGLRRGADGMHWPIGEQAR